MREAAGEIRHLAFVPTMGNLHEGHLALVRTAQALGDGVAVSIFVNPLQFGPNEDFARYPRTFDTDCEKLERLGVDLVFAPDDKVLYPEPQAVVVQPPPVASELCGAARPGHFAGVATVVLKLFNIVQPKIAVFGKKDYQQLHIVRQVVRQLNLDVEVHGGDTVRAPDGLALSSRNQYLDVAQREEAPRLYRVLGEIAKALRGGCRDWARLESAGRAELEQAGWRMDYLTIRSQTTLQAPDERESSLVVLAAGHLGPTRLIDNIEVCLDARSAV